MSIYITSLNDHLYHICLMHALHFIAVPRYFGVSTTGMIIVKSPLVAGITDIEVKIAYSNEPKQTIVLPVRVNVQSEFTINNQGQHVTPNANAYIEVCKKL